MSFGSVLKGALKKTGTPAIGWKKVYTHHRLLMENLKSCPAYRRPNHHRPGPPYWYLRQSQSALHSVAPLARLVDSASFRLLPPRVSVRHRRRVRREDHSYQTMLATGSLLQRFALLERV